ncbi:MAG: hypothetical protein J6N15_10735 [Ruminiclostridium sp.]|nr:hypothetical protein [Ruminiclostridium sp.]
MAEQTSNKPKNKVPERISSPDQLSECLHATDPGAWIVLGIVLLLLSGILAWSVFGSLETSVVGVADVSDSTAKIYYIEEAIGKIKPGMTVKFETQTTEITDVINTEYGDEVALAPVAADDGIYDVRIVTAGVHPITFLLN